MCWFFVDGDFRKSIDLDRIPDHPDAHYTILNESAIAHVGLGETELAIELYTANLKDCQTKAQGAEKLGDLKEFDSQLEGVRAQHQNLAEAYRQSADFARMEVEAKNAYMLSFRADDGPNQRDSLILLGTAQRLAGKAPEAERSFGMADGCAETFGPARDIWGLMRAEALLESSEPERARDQVERIRRANPPPQVEAQALKIRGDIAQALGEPGEQIALLYRRAVARARTTTARPILEEAERAKARFERPASPVGSGPAPARLGAELYR